MAGMVAHLRSVCLVVVDGRACFCCFCFVVVAAAAAAVAVRL